MTHVADPFVPDARPAAVVLRGAGWGAVAGAVSGALFVAPLVAWNGPLEALVIYPPLAAVPGALVGVVVGLVGGGALACTHPRSTSRAREVGALTGLLCVGWLAFVLPWFGLWALVLATASGALVGPRVSARRSGAGAAAGTTSPGSSRGPGR